MRKGKMTLTLNQKEFKINLIAQMFVSSNCLYFHQIIIIFPLNVVEKI